MKIWLCMEFFLLTLPKVNIRHSVLKMALLGNIMWRLKCPQSIDDIAKHFVDTHIPNEQIGKHNFSTAYIDLHDPWFAYRRRIAFIYGVAVCYKSSNGEPAKRGWNRSLWRNHKILAPDELVEVIFDATLEHLKRITEEVKY